LFPQPKSCGLIEARDIEWQIPALRRSFRSQRAAASLKLVELGYVRLTMHEVSAAKELRPH